MKRKITLSLIISVLLFISCSAQKDSTNNKEIITVENNEDLEKYVGELITIKGEVTNTKIPTLIGVDISSDSPDLRGKIGIATGILEKRVVLEDDVDIYSANRGAGTFYRLREPNSNYEAQVQEIK